MVDPETLSALVRGFVVPGSVKPILTAGYRVRGSNTLMYYVNYSAAWLGGAKCLKLNGYSRGVGYPMRGPGNA